MINWRPISELPAQTGVYLMWVESDITHYSHIFGTTTYRHPDDEPNTHNMRVWAKTFNITVEEAVEKYHNKSRGWDLWTLETETHPDLEYHYTFWAEIENSPYHSNLASGDCGTLYYGKLHSERWPKDE